MLASKYRFHSRGGVRYTYRKGKTIYGKKLTLIFAPNTRNARRFAVVVSKKILKSAVGRNRIRRRVYEAIRSLLSQYPNPNDYIFIVTSKEVADIPFDRLASRVKDVIHKANTPTD
jgi:ribonuclease P protein component